MKKLLLVQEDDGVVVGAIEPGDKVVRSASKKSFAQLEAESMKWDIKEFQRVNSEEYRLLIPKLTNPEKAIFCSLLAYVNYGTCLIAYPNGRDINLEDIMEICDCSRRTAIENVASLVKKDVLYKGKNSHGNQYYMNPWLISKGMVLNKVLKSMFKNYYINTLKCKWKDLK